jgi:hypothetical protein
LPEFLVRSGECSVIVAAADRVGAIEQAVLMQSEHGKVVMGEVTQVINLDECEAATWYTKTQGVLELLKFEERSCGSDVAITKPSSVN